MSTMLDWAIWYHNSGLCVVPVKPRDKAVALDSWEEYQARQSTREEVTRWFGNGNVYNIGIVHGVNNFVSLDFDHDAGIFAKMKAQFSELFDGRIEQSGSGQGYHVPLFVDDLPELGHDNKKDRPKGNKTWHGNAGDVNIRARWCQTVVPPSIHPSGGAYKFIQQGEIVRLADLSDVIAWLNRYDARQAAIVPRRQAVPSGNGGVSVKTLFPSILDAFRLLGYTNATRKEPGGGIRICDSGGLVLNESEGTWYNFSDEIGGDVVDAFGWAQFGSGWDRYNKTQFVQVVKRMRELAGVGEVRAELPRSRQTRRICGDMARGYWG